jgi:hypothetical protein
MINEIMSEACIAIERRRRLISGWRRGKDALPRDPAWRGGGGGGGEGGEEGGGVGGCVD